MPESDTMFNERDRRCRRCTTHVLYQSKLWQQDHCQLPQNANPDGSTLGGTAQCIGRPLGGGGAEGHRRNTRTKEFIEKVLAIIDETPQRPIRQLVSHITVNACVKEDLKCRSYRRQTSQILIEKTKNLKLIKSVRSRSSPDLNPLDYFVWSYVENVNNMTSHNTKASLIAAIRRARKA